MFLKLITFYGENGKWGYLPFIRFYAGILMVINRNWKLYLFFTYHKKFLHINKIIIQSEFVYLKSALDAVCGWFCVPPLVTTACVFISLSAGYRGWPQITLELLSNNTRVKYSFHLFIKYLFYFILYFSVFPTFFTIFWCKRDFTKTKIKNISNCAKDF